ncbi:hypothetical protein ON010_g15005 [Phytophthora cinnamomi]|nr:hypothetical protein ON010_g15005 [Phytophthora cinnamomi]
MNLSELLGTPDAVQPATDCAIFFTLSADQAPKRSWSQQQPAKPPKHPTHKPKKSIPSNTVIYNTVPDKNRKKPNRLSAAQKQTRRDNEVFESRILNLTLDINQLRQEVLHLKECRDLHVTRLLLDRERMETNILNAANSMLFGTGGGVNFAQSAADLNFSGLLVGPWAQSTPDGVYEFVLQLDTPITGQKPGAFCTTQVLSFVEEDLGTDNYEAAELRRICGGPGGCVVEAVGDLTGRFAYEAIIYAFPRALECGLESRMVGSTITCPARLLLYFTAQHHVVQQIAQIEISSIRSWIHEVRFIATMGGATMQ